MHPWLTSWSYTWRIIPCCLVSTFSWNVLYSWIPNLKKYWCHVSISGSVSETQYYYYLYYKGNVLPYKAVVRFAKGHLHLNWFQIYPLHKPHWNGTLWRLTFPDIPACFSSSFCLNVCKHGRCADGGISLYHWFRIDIKRESGSWLLNLIATLFPSQNIRVIPKSITYSLYNVTQL